MIKRLGFVDAEKFMVWVKKYDSQLQPEKWNGRELKNCGRSSMWFGKGVDLGLNWSIYDATPIESGLQKRCDDLYPGFNSLLLYRYEPGSELKPHFDREAFDHKVVIINIAQDDLFGGSTKFIYNNKTEILSNGEIIQIDSRVRHGVAKVDRVRYSLSIRKV